jgi:hypothetical protein
MLLILCWPSVGHDVNGGFLALHERSRDSPADIGVWCDDHLLLSYIHTIASQRRRRRQRVGRMRCPRGVEHATNHPWVDGLLWLLTMIGVGVSFQNSL